MLTDVGYRLIEVASGAVLNQWGGVVGEMPAIPSRIDVPGKQIHCPAVGVEYDGYRLDLWQIEAESTLRCSASQFRRAALQIGLLDAIEAAAAAASMPRDWQIKWEYAPEYRRADPDWDAAAAALGKTPADVDALFALAVTL